jgi:hypothetical protein
VLFAPLTAPPVTSIPRGPSAAITTQRGELVSVALPHRAGLSWRIARPPNARFLREVAEADVGRSVVVVFRTMRKGRAKVVFALTRGESARGLASRTYTVTIR